VKNQSDQPNVEHAADEPECQGREQQAVWRIGSEARGEQAGQHADRLGAGDGETLISVLFIGIGQDKPSKATDEAAEKLESGQS
jgi:hypothetical protein